MIIPQSAQTSSGAAAARWHRYATASPPRPSSDLAVLPSPHTTRLESLACLQHAASLDPAQDGLLVEPTAPGDALAFFNFDESAAPEALALHAGMPVAAGEIKWIGAHFFRAPALLHEGDKATMATRARRMEYVATERARRAASPEMSASAPSTGVAYTSAANDVRDALHRAGEAFAGAAAEVPKGFSHGALALTNAAAAIDASGDATDAAGDLLFGACQLNDPPEVGAAMERAGECLEKGDMHGAAEAMRTAARAVGEYGALLTYDSAGALLDAAAQELDKAASALDALEH